MVGVFAKTFTCKQDSESTSEDLTEECVIAEEEVAEASQKKSSGEKG